MNREPNKLPAHVYTKFPSQQHQHHYFQHAQYSLNRCCCVLYALSGLSVSSIVSVSLHLASHRFSDILIHVCIYVILKYYTHNSVWTSVKWCAAARYAVHFVLFSHSFNRRDWKTSRRLFSSPKKTTHCIGTTT